MKGFALGTVLRCSTRIWLHNLVPFLLIGAILFAPLVVYTAWAFGDTDHAVIDTLGLFFIVAAVASFVLGQLVTAALAYGIVQDLSGQPASIGRTLGRGLTCMFPVLGVSVVLGIVVCLGYLYLAIPGLVLQTSFFVAVPCAVIEGAGVDRSMKRSMALTSGHKRHLLAVVLLMALVDAGLFFLVRTGVGEVYSLADARVFAAGVLLMLLLTTTLRSVIAAVAYYELRRVKEGVGIEQLAAVFD